VNAFTEAIPVYHLAASELRVESHIKYFRSRKRCEIVWSHTECAQ